MRHATRFALKSPDRHFNCPDHHVTILSVMHGSTNNQLAEQIENHAQKETSFLRRYLCEIRYPFAI